MAPTLITRTLTGVEREVEEATTNIGFDIPPMCGFEWYEQPQSKQKLEPKNTKQTKS
jgi:hypothetical protein